MLPVILVLPKHGIIGVVGTWLGDPVVQTASTVLDIVLRVLKQDTRMKVISALVCRFPFSVLHWNAVKVSLSLGCTY